MLSGRYVFLIEDEAPRCEVRRQAIEDDGARVTILKDGPTALALLDEVRPDVILLDSGLPSIGSYELVDEFLRSRGPHAPGVRARR